VSAQLGPDAMETGARVIDLCDPIDGEFTVVWDCGDIIRCSLPQLFRHSTGRPSIIAPDP